MRNKKKKTKNINNNYLEFQLPNKITSDKKEEGRCHIRDKSCKKRRIVVDRGLYHWDWGGKWEGRIVATHKL